ncbi:Uma2 family endonuclease [Haloferula sp. BvORR071]|uniref:Uma2 family endonuclease n=1 Tax=Haloferula sp. BvORR071 TaxID=1396141 RepID=UPI00069749BC|nr:Uma2 family endonuclease [Haloferula sp. BvORR071]
MTVTLDLPEIRDRHAFNLARWKEICADPQLSKVEGRIESDAHGHILMSPPPGFSHSSRQGAILALLLKKSGGRALPECPVSTSGGVRGVDAVWISDSRAMQALKENVLIIAPEICVEVLSSGNTRAEMEEKRGLLFGAGAEEVWFCDGRGRMFFFMKEEPENAAVKSRLCPDFPVTVE